MRLREQRSKRVSKILFIPMMILTILLSSVLAHAKMAPCHVKVELEATPGFMMEIQVQEITSSKAAPAKSCPFPKKGEDPKKLCASQNHGSIVNLQNGQILYTLTSLKDIEDQIKTCQMSL